LVVGKFLGCVITSKEFSYRKNLKKVPVTTRDELCFENGIQTSLEIEEAFIYICRG
jgi:hypothetical protein